MRGYLWLMVGGLLHHRSDDDPKASIEKTAEMKNTILEELSHVDGGGDPTHGRGGKQNPTGVKWAKPVRKVKAQHLKSARRSIIISEKKDDLLGRENNTMSRHGRHRPQKRSIGEKKKQQRNVSRPEKEIRTHN